jgi:IclR family acetate operon transcriptional repressor
MNEQLPPHDLVPAVERAIRILLAFESGDEAYGVSDLSRRLDVNKSTVYNIINTLTHFGFLERDNETRTYRLGPTLFHLGNRVSSRLTLREIAHPHLRELARRLHQTVVLNQLTVENDILTADAVVPEATMVISTSIGYRLPHSAGAPGKIFHTALSKAELQELLREHGLRSFTERTIVEPAAYRGELETVRSQGYAIDDEEYLQGVRAIAAPVVGHDNYVVAALCVVGFSSLLTDDRLHELARVVPAVAKEISQSIGAMVYPSWIGVRRVAVKASIGAEQR